MPYYVVKPKEDEGENINSYHYIPYKDSIFDNKSVDEIIDYFSKTDEDPFEELFGDTSKFTPFKSKRFNKKYSRFLMGNDTIKSSTLFRGVKFEIIELENDKEVNPGKYNGYKFSFIYVPVTDDEYVNDEELRKIQFIKNDTFKFVVGIVFFNTNTEEIKDFNKAFVYAGAMGYLDKEDWQENN